MARTWIEFPRDTGWGDIRIARGALGHLGYTVAELRGTGPVLLRLSGTRLESGEALRMPGQR